MAVWDGRLNPCVSISTELALAQMIDFLSVGRNRRPVRPAALHAEFDFRALFLFAHFLFGRAKRKWADAIEPYLLLELS
jgi:hypothetical protein